MSIGSPWPTVPAWPVSSLHTMGVHPAFFEWARKHRRGPAATASPDAVASARAALTACSISGVCFPTVILKPASGAAGAAACAAGTVPRTVRAVIAAAVSVRNRMMSTPFVCRAILLADEIEPCTTGQGRHGNRTQFQPCTHQTGRCERNRTKPTDGTAGRFLQGPAAVGERPRHRPGGAGRRPRRGAGDRRVGAGRPPRDEVLVVRTEMAGTASRPSRIRDPGGPEALRSRPNSPSGSAGTRHRTREGRSFPGGRGPTSPAGTRRAGTLGKPTESGPATSWNRRAGRG